MKRAPGCSRCGLKATALAHGSGPNTHPFTAAMKNSQPQACGPLSQTQPPAPRDLVAEAEGAALEVLRAGYRRDVAAMAESLKPRFLAGEFNGADGGYICCRKCYGNIAQGSSRCERCGIDVKGDSHWVSDYFPRFFGLQAICEKHPRVATEELARITWAFASARARKVVEAGAACAFAYDVRAFAIRNLGIPDDGTWTVGGAEALEAAAKARAKRRTARKATGKVAGWRGGQASRKPRRSGAEA